jgi:hypothetical protein
MIRGTIYVLTTIAAAIIVVAAAPILLWLGRPVHGEVE